MREILKLGLKLFIIAAVAGLALGGVYVITEGPIEEQTIAAQNAARREVLPEASSFELVDSGKGIYAGMDQSGTVVGYTLARITIGYGGEIEVTVGVSLEGVITGVSVGGTNFSETAGLGAKAKEPWFAEQYKGLSGDIALSKDGGTIDAISSATITSSAVTHAVDDAFKALMEYMEGVK